MKRLLLGRYATAKKVTLVCDNLNTHLTGAFYEAFEADEARSFLNRLDLQYTPKHGSWLNIAENELKKPRGKSRLSLGSHYLELV